MKYIYPVNIDAIMAEGLATPTTFTPGSQFTNPYFANNQNIRFAVGGLSNNDALRFDFTNNVIPKALVIYIETGASGASAVLYRSSDGVNLTQVDPIPVGSFTNTGWFVLTLDPVPPGTRYFVIRFTGTIGSLDFSEVYFGGIFTFPYNYQLGNSFSKVYGVDSIGNREGDEFTNKRHDAKWIRTWNWKNFDQTAIDEYDIFDSAVDGTRAKFLWDDDSDLWWVKNIVGINYTEAGCSAYDPRSGLRQQLY